MVSRARRAIRNDSFCAVVAIEFGGCVRKRDVFEHQHAAPPAKFVGQRPNGFRVKDRRTGSRNDDVARRFSMVGWRRMAIQRIEANAPFNHRYFELRRIAPDEEIRSRIGDVLLAAITTMDARHHV